MSKLRILLAASACVAASAFAQGGITAKQSEVMKQLLATYEATAKSKPSAADGRAFYLKRRTWQKTDPTCSNCHTEDPTKPGVHMGTKHPIKPLAPAANPDRFTDAAKVERNFTEHCVDLLGRHCEAREKGNFIAYLMEVK